MSEIVAAYMPEFIITVFIIFNLVASLFFNTYLYKLSKWFTLLGDSTRYCVNILFAD